MRMSSTESLGTGTQGWKMLGAWQSRKRCYQLINWTVTRTQADIDTDITQTLHFWPTNETANHAIWLEFQKQIAHRFRARAIAWMKVSRTV